MNDATSTDRERAHIPPSVKTALALLVAPISGSTIAAIILTARSGYFNLANPIETLLTIGMITMVGGLMVGMPVALSLGWLVHMLLVRIRFTDAFTYICLGTSLAMATLRIVFWQAFTQAYSPQDQMIEAFINAGIAGGAGALVFWLIRRPDRDAISAPPQP